MSKTPDKEKIANILTALEKYPKGIWIRALARDLKMPVSSLHYRLYKYLANKIAFERLEYHGFKGGYILIKLKK